MLIIVAFIAMTSGLIVDYPTNSTTNSLTVLPVDLTSQIALENQQLGTRAWQLDVGANTTYIQGYAGRVSALPGETVPLYISTVSPISYNLDVYRIGWYGSLGGRLYASAHDLKSVAQGTWTFRTGLSGCPTCSLDPKTHLLETHWRSTYALTIGDTWISGVYLIKLTAANHAESYIPLVVRADTAHTAMLVSLPVNTYQAYNIWGNYSLYGASDNDGQAIMGERAYAVSFDRPYDRSDGAGDFLAWDIHTVRWMERSALDVSYTTDVDVSEQPNLLLTHRIFMALGHDEYWTLSMRNGIEAARNQGVSLAFMGANDAYWQNRYATNSLGQRDRTIICYKVTGYNPTMADAPKLDPFYPQHMDQVTAQWRDPLLGRPESALLGLEYHSYFSGTYHPDWVVRMGSLAPLEAETGLQPGQHIKGGLLGYEYDGLGLTKYTPKNLVELSESPLISRYGVFDRAYSAYYTAPSGALVFDAGSIWWAWGLDESSPVGAYEANALKGNAHISKLMTNLLNAMLVATPKAPGLSSLTPTPTTHDLTPTPSIKP